jgi:hypothetical protein
MSQPNNRALADALAQRDAYMARALKAEAELIKRPVMKDEHTPRFEAPRGISRRDYFALHIYCALIGKSLTRPDAHDANTAVTAADELLEELDLQTQKNG